MKRLILTVMSVMVASAWLGATVRADDDPAAQHPPGIYYYSAAKKKLTKLETTSYGKTKQGFAFGAAFGQTTKTKAVIPGGHATVQLPEQNPVFYFHFGQAAAGLGEDASNDPDNYVLSSMEIKDSGTTRRLIVGKAGAYGSKKEADKKSAQGFTTEKVRDGVFKVTLDKPLAPGEYCFFRVGSETVFDFGVQGGAATAAPAPAPAKTK